MFLTVCMPVILSVSYLPFVKEDHIAFKNSDVSLELALPNEIKASSAEEIKDSLLPFCMKPECTSCEKYQANLTPERSVKILDRASGSTCRERLKDVRFSTISWDSHGFYYTRKKKVQKVYYHQVDTPQSADLLVYQDSRHPNRIYHTQMSKDQKHLVLYILDQKLPGWAVFVKNLQQMEKPFETIVCNIDL